MTEQQMRRSIDALGFAQFEIMLYLDVHPSNMEAQAQWKKNAMRLEEMERQYKAATGNFWPVRHDRSGGSREWVDSPWPWEGSGR